MTYKKHLITAIDRTRGNGITVRDFVIESASYPIINDLNKKELQELLNEQVYSKPFEEIETQCILHSWHVQDAVSEILNCDVLPTFGYLVTQSQKFFYTDESEILQWAEIPASLRREIHAWLTLPSLEIIDITLAATGKALAKPGDLHKDYNYKTFMHYRPDEHYGKLDRVYHAPQFVDNAFLERVNLLKYLS